MSITRRSMLRSTAWAAVAVSVPVLQTGCSFLPALPTFTEPDNEAALAWLQFTSEGRFQFMSPRQEMGQGINISLKQIIAEELGISLELIDLVLLSTDRVSEVKATVGSESIVLYAEPTARAAASLREVLKQRGATRLGLSISDVRLTDDGLRGGGQSLSYIDLASGERLVLTPGQLFTHPLKSFTKGSHRFVGKSQVTEQILEIVTGAPIYSGDVRLEGMLYGGMARPPKLQSEMLGADTDKALALPGVIHVFKDGDSIGVVAETPMALQAGIQALEIRWRTGAVEQAAIDALLGLGDSDRKLEHEIRGDTLDAEQPWTCDIHIDIPMAAHMCIETRTSVASWHGHTIELWSSTQDPFMVRSAVGKSLDVSRDNVVVHSCRSGGSFGGNGHWADVDAARLSRAVGRPVKVQWTRPENFQTAYHRPPSSHRVRVRVNDAGEITDWWHRFKSGHVVFTSGLMPPWLQNVTSFVADFGVARGANPPYRMMRTKVEFEDVRIPVDTGPWRGLGAGPNCFAVETAMDAAAQSAGIDPVEFRLNHIEDQRLRNTLSQVTLMAQWKAGGPRNGRGVACGIYKEMSYAAVVAEVSLDSQNETFRVEHLYCAHDCGQVINPDQVRAQVEGNLVWAIGMVKTERLSVAGGRIGADYPGQYQIPTMVDIPAMTIELVQTDGMPPTGAGETAIVCAAAITNALSGLLNKPVARLPVEPEFLRT